MNPIETALGRLGSRFCLNLRPQSREVGHGALGRYFDAVADLVMGVAVDGQRRVLPLCKAGEVFESVDMELTMTSVTFRCESRPLKVGLDVTLRAPFYPQDVQSSTAPVFFLDLTAHALVPPGQPRPTFDKPVEVFLGFVRPDTKITPRGRGLDLAYTLRIEPRQQVSWFDPKDPNTIPNRDWKITRVRCAERIEASGGEARVENLEIRWRVDLSSRSQTVLATWVARVADPVFERGGRVHRFLAARYQDSLDALSAWAFEQREELVRKSQFFDAVIDGLSLSKTHRNLVAFTFQSYLINTWWVEDEAGEDWFSVWEGVCRFHSTIDVEYNLALLYFALWPELLEKTFAEWADYEKPGPPDHNGRRTGFLSHDMGACLHADGQHYPHEMEVEEDTNFILLLHAYWRWTGRDEVPARHAKLLQRLIRYIIASDTTGNGFPDRGVANTIDDASPAVQYAREQTYLAVKSLCAARAAADLARLLRDDALLAECEAFAERTLSTLDRDAWLGDHYAVCIDRSAADVVNVWTGKPLPPGPLEGWDAYSIYTANGLLLPLMAGLETGLDPDRIRLDLRAGLERARTEYGCTHTSADRANVWISQNLWRDFVAAYLGLDFLSESDRYWAFEVRSNRKTPGHCFIDTCGWNGLEYYPRGITSIGLFLAAVGLRVDAPARRIRLSPVRVPIRLPLLPFVDWDKCVVPWVEYILEDGRVACCIDGRGTLRGWDIDVGEVHFVESAVGS